MSFTGYFSAREKLEAWIDEHTLCLRYCGLTDDTSVCFNHQLKKCNGICAEQEEIELYNKRAKAILEEYMFTHPNFVIIDKGKSHTQQSVILIEKGHYAGYGYIDTTEQISSPEEFKTLVKRTNYYPDADDLVKGWMKQNEKIKKVIL